MARDNEVVCLCGEYDHPHRLGGGRCTGAAWCQAFREIDSFDCDSCNLNGPDGCEVITGVESIEHAPCVAEELRTQYLRDEYGHLPLDVWDYWTKQEQDYRDHEN